MRPLILVVLALFYFFSASSDVALGAGASPDRRAPGATSIDLSAAPPGTVPATAGGLIPLILESDPPHDRLLRRVAELGGKVEYDFAHLPVVAAAIPREQVAELLADPQVLAVERQKWMSRAVAPVEVPGRGRVPESELHGFGANAVATPIPFATLRAQPLAPAGGIGLQTFLGYDIVTGAAEVWEDAGFGAGTVVVVVDTGIFPKHPLLAGSVIGGLNLVPAAEEELIDRNQDSQPDGRAFDWDAIENHEHGTFVSGLIAGHADLFLPVKSSLAQSLALHSPESVAFIDSVTARVSLMGTAPAASLFGIKVFPYDGGEAPDARVAEAIDRVIRMKCSGELVTDVINLSLGGATLWDGREVVDRMVDAASDAGITVVVAAGNSGPSLVTTGTPANAFTALTVGGAVDPIHTRVAFEQFFPGPPGIGAVVYPHESLQVIGFSARGLTGDGRVKPDILATGFLNFSATLEDVDHDGFNDETGFGFGAGTSFSTPTVAGAAALLVAYARSIGGHDEAPFIANVLMHAADPIARFRRLREVEQGKGFVRLPEAFALLAAGEGGRPPARDRSHRGIELRGLGHDGSVSGETGDLGPGETRSFIVKVLKGVSRIDFTFPEVQLSDTQNPLFGDAIAVLIHSAKRGGTGDYVFFAGPLEAGASFAYAFPEPGDLRVTFDADLTNVGPVSATLEAHATSEPVAFDVSHRGSVRRDGTWEEEMEVPEELAALGVALSWHRDWRHWPTRNLDLFLIDPDGATVAGGATLRSPELVLVEKPQGGTWRLRVVDDGTLRGREHFRVRAKFFDELPENAMELLAADEESGRPGREKSSAPAVEGSPLGLKVLGATPNPFNPATTIRFELAGGAGAAGGMGEADAGNRIGLRIFDANGRLVRILFDGVVAPGAQAVVWDGRGDRGQQLGSGVYFYEIATPVGKASGKLLLAK